MEASENKDEVLEALLTAALKSESVHGLPYGFAAMVTRKAFAQKNKYFAVKTYALVLLAVIVISALLLALLSLISPELTAALFSVLKSAKYIIGFTVASFFLIEYADHRWVRV